MRYSIRQINSQVNPSGELWLVRTTKKGVWGAQARAFAFFRRPTAVRWVGHLTASNPGIALEVVEFDERSLSVSLDAPKPDEASLTGTSGAGEDETGAENDTGLAPAAPLT